MPDTERGTEGLVERLNEVRRECWPADAVMMIDARDAEIRRLAAEVGRTEAALREIGCMYGGPANAEPCQCPVCRALTRKGETDGE